MSDKMLVIALLTIKLCAKPHVFGTPERVRHYLLRVNPTWYNCSLSIPDFAAQLGPVV